MVVYYAVLLEETIDEEALELRLTGLAAQIVNLAAIALEAAAEEIIPADGIADLETLALGGRVDLVDIAYTLVAYRDSGFRAEIGHEIRMAERRGVRLDQELVFARHGDGNVIYDDLLLFLGQGMSAGNLVVVKVFWGQVQTYTVPLSSLHLELVCIEC